MSFSLVAFRIKMWGAVLGILLLGFALALGIAGYFYGFKNAPFLITGILVFLGFITFFQWLIGPYLINLMYRAVEVTPQDPQYGWLYDLVNEVAAYNKMSPPKVYIADVPFPNAFAYGNPIAGKRVAVTLPALRIMNREELKAVLGHELGHLKHRDVEVMMAVSLIPTLIYWLGYSIMWGGILGGGRNGNNFALMYLIGLALLAVSFLFQLFVLYINRLRESYADINSVQTVPNAAENLQLALAKLVLAVDPNAVERYKKGLMSMLFFVTPVEDVPEYKARELVEVWKHTKVPVWAELFSTHPHPAKRIQMLEKLKNPSLF